MYDYTIVALREINAGHVEQSTRFRFMDICEKYNTINDTEMLDTLKNISEKVYYGLLIDVWINELCECIEKGVPAPIVNELAAKYTTDNYPKEEMKKDIARAIRRASSKSPEEDLEEALKDYDNKGTKTHSLDKIKNLFSR